MAEKIFLPVFLLIILICPCASAQTVDALIKKNFDAHGGAHKLKAIKSTRVTGKIEMQGINAPITLITKRPNLARVEIALQSGPYIEGYDGKTAWRVNSLTGSHDPEIISGEEAKDILEASDMDSPLLDYRRKGHKVELLGKENVEGVDAYKLKLTQKNGEVKYIYLNSRTYLGFKQITRRLDHGVEIEVELYFGDYKPVGGLLLAHSYEARVENQTVQITTIEKIEINPLIDNSVFSMPLKAEVRRERRFSDSSTVTAADNLSRALRRRPGRR